jgi:hypothetical protein
MDRRAAIAGYAGTGHPAARARRAMHTLAAATHSAHTTWPTPADVPAGELTVA